MPASESPAIPTEPLLRQLDVSAGQARTISCLCGLPEDLVAHPDLPLGYAMLLTVFRLFGKMGLSESERFAAVKYSQETITAEPTADRTFDNTPVIQILDNRYLGCSGQTQTLHLETGKLLDSLPGPPIISQAIFIEGARLWLIGTFLSSSPTPASA